jgi:hypothetical protein
VSRRGGRRRPAAMTGAAALLLASLGVAGCAEVPTSTPATYQPAALESTSADGPKKVTFTAEAAARVHLMTAEVASRGDQLVVDYAALVYDKSGEPWVFTVVAPLEFLRVAAEIDRIEGDQVLLDRGPAAGTHVVTQGAIEVWGAELGISGKH